MVQYNPYKAKNTQNIFIVYILCLGMHLYIYIVQIGRNAWE